MKTLIFTGGHHSGSLQVAIRLKSQGWNIVWFGHKYSMWGDTNVSGEYTDITQAEISFIDLKAGKFYRTFNPIKLSRIPIGFLQAWFILLKLKLKLGSDLKGIVSSGGYLAVPTVICGWMLGIPSLTHEQTAVNGWANRLISIFAKKTAVTWPPAKLNHKTVYTGLPLRPELSKPHLHHLASNTIYITGGKQGSHRLNEVVFSCLPRLLEKYSVIHQTGSSSLHKDYEYAARINSPKYTHFSYDSKKAVEALLKSEIVISRAGAHTVYELAALKKKCVLIPIPWVSHNEQFANAQLLVKNHQAILLPEAELNPNNLLQSIKSALELKPQNLFVPVDAVDRLQNLVNQTFI